MADQKGRDDRPYYILPSERLQELLERAQQGENVADLLAEEYINGRKEQVDGND